MMKCKFYSDYICNYYWNGSCHFSEKVFGGPPASCYYTNDFENCICFEPPIECEKGSSSYNLEDEKTETVKLKPDSDRPIEKRTLTIQNCDRIILKPRSLEVEVKIETANFDDFDFIEINGHKFKKV